MTRVAGPGAPRSDVIVIGGGVAGLTAARQLHRAGLQVLLLEAAAHTGGRAATVPMGPYSFNTGAQVITGTTGPTSVLADSLGVQAVRIRKERMPLHMHGRYVRARTEPGFLLRLPLSLRDKVRVGTSVLAMRYRHRVAARIAAGAIADDPGVRRLERSTVAELVGAHRSADLRALWDTLSVSVTSVSSDEASALVAIKTVPTLQSRGEYAIVGGTGALTDALLHDVRGITCTDAHVTEIRDTGTAVEVRYTHQGRDVVTDASQVVLAVPAPVVLDVVRDLPDWKRDVLQATDYRPLATAAFLHHGPTEGILGHGVWRIPVVGGPLVGVVNATIWEPAETRDRSGLGLIRVQATDAASERLASRTDEEVADVLFDALVSLFPAVRDRRVESAVAQWPHGVSPWRPGRVDRLPALRASTGRLHYCGDYLDEQGMAGSIESAIRAAAAAADALVTGGSSG